MSATCPRCGAEAAGLALCPACLLETELAPAMLGEHLELRELVGEGGMGTVFAARDSRLGREVVVKVLPPALAGNSELHARFDREARALAMLNHPNIVTVHELGEEEGQPFIVMERVDGGSLASRLPLPVEETIALGIQICDALDYAHDQGVVHRDVKPENVLLTSDGRAKLADFGIARILRDENAITAPQQAVGTPHYVAPETLRGAEPDPRMDIFSLGVLLYQTATGQLPVADFGNLPPNFAAVIQRAVANDPAARFASAREMGEALFALRTGGASDELPPDQRVWLRAVAMVQTLASAVALWALWVCITPKVIAPEEVRPLIMLATETLADGRIVSRARFEIWPVLGAALAVGVAIAMYGFLRRQWRQAGLEQRRPNQVVREARVVAIMGALAVGVFAVHKLFLDRIDLLAILMPVFGGLFELILLWFFWMAILELWRHGRPLHREWRLWLGIGIAQIPPATSLILFLRSWVP